MPTVVRNPYVSATLAGVSVGQILSARCSFGFDLRVSEAYITVPVPPTTGYYWDPVVLTMGATPGTARTRFTGVLLEKDYSLWPRAVTLVCKGNLYRAAIFENTNVLGTDLTNNSAGQTDQAMVNQVLGAVTGLSYNTANIGGTGKTFGKVAVQVASSGWGNIYTGPFTWGGPGLLNQSVGETALSFIERLDSVCEGYRLFETSGGTLYRFQISGRPRNAWDLTFTEGVDIFSGQSQRTLIQARNRILVNGYDRGIDTPNNFFILTYATLATSGLDQTYAFQSPMIEQTKIADGTAQSCEAVATYLINEFDREIVKLQMVTPRDDMIGPGQTHLIQGGPGGTVGRLGIGEPLWVNRVDVEVSEQGAFSQTVTYIGGGLADNTQPPPV